jgi:ribonuclease E
MPSGGYLFIQQTEALTVIDVNSGKFVSSATQDETILKTNIEAVHEIARQLRLRNIGGMVIIDFIDMTSRADKLAMLEELEIALEADKAKPQVGQLSDLGLVELTRHRQGQSLAEIFTKKCPHCQGSGCSVIDFNFATPVAEGEYRAKAAKIKLPTGAFKKNKFNNKNNNNQPQQNIEEQEQQEIKPVTIETEPSAAATEETIKKENNKRNKRRFDKNKKRQEQVSAPEDTAKSEDVVPEVTEQPQEPTEKPAKRTRRTSKKAVKEEIAETAPVVEQPSEEPAPKRTKRPNRGASKRTRKTAKTEGNSEE